MLTKVTALKARLPRLPRLAYAFGEASNALMLVLFVLLARGLGKERWGDFIAIIAASAILQTIAEWGLHTLLTRTVARAPEHAWAELRGAMGRQVLVCLPVPLLVYGYMRIAGISTDAHLGGVLIAVSVCIRAVKESVRGVCRGLGSFGTEALFNWTERLSLLVGGAITIALGGAFTALGLLFLTIRAVDFAIFLGIMRRRLRPGRAPAATEATLAAALPFGVSNLMWSVYYQVDTTLLAALATPRDAGVYGAIYRFVDFVQVLPRVLIVVAFPRMAGAWARDRAAFHHLFSSLQRLITSVALPVLFVLAAWSGFALELAFGAEYREGAQALQYIMLGNFFAFHSMLFVQTLQAAHRERALAAGLTATVLINVVLNVILIPPYGFWGAAVATAASEVVYAAALATIAWREGVTEGFRFGALELVAVAVLAGIAFGIEWLTEPWVVLVLAAGWALVLVRVRPDRILLERAP